MQVDDYGRVVLSTDEIVDLLYEGVEITQDILAQSGEDIAQYNELCRINDKLPYRIEVEAPKQHSPEEEHDRRMQSWFMPSAYAEMDVWSVLRTRCRTDEEIARLEGERVEYERRDLLPLLRLMMYLIDEFRRRKVVWGVGRGSSVASYALYLIGITKINPMKYGLDIGDFLKD